jgi:RNA polymerase sigma-70 factor, ECF subfamily
MPLAYEDLRRLAELYMAAEKFGHTLQTAALVHEAYFRLTDLKEASQNRAHFFAMAALAMRHILVDHARTRDAARRCGGAAKVSFEEAVLLTQQQDVGLLALNKALSDLSAVNRRKSQVVEPRYSGGLSVEETAEVLECLAGDGYAGLEAG